MAQLVNPWPEEKSFLIYGNDIRKYRDYMTDAKFEAESPNVYRALEGSHIRYRDLIPGNYLQYKSLDAKSGEQYDLAFSDLCLMWPSALPSQVAPQ